ncbi:MAG: PaaI family thioesterase [Cuniculiplasma divulgatum]|nr:MAG: PaaI family thioesterase [Cuniculiplasma divulgatum]
MIDEISQILKMDNYLANMQIEVVEAHQGHVEFRVPLMKNMMRIGDIANGGATMTLLDAAGGMAVFTLVEGSNQVTVNLNTNFIRKIDKGPLKVTADVVRKGRNIAFARMEITDSEGKLCADATGTWYIFGHV